MANLTLADIRKLYRPDGTLLLPHEWPDEIAVAVAGVEVFEELAGRGRTGPSSVIRKRCGPTTR